MIKSYLIAGLKCVTIKRDINKIGRRICKKENCKRVNSRREKLIGRHCRKINCRGLISRNP